MNEIQGHGEYKEANRFLKKKFLGEVVVKKDVKTFSITATEVEDVKKVHKYLKEIVNKL